MVISLVSSSHNRGRASKFLLVQLMLKVHQGPQIILWTKMVNTLMKMVKESESLLTVLGEKFPLLWKQAHWQAVQRNIQVLNCTM